MARLPVDAMTATDQSVLPTERLFPSQRMASPEDFGAGSGAAIQSFGHEVTNLGSRIAANQQQLQAFNNEDARIKTENNISTNYAVDQRGLTGDGEGFWVAQRANATKQYDALINSVDDPTEKAKLTARRDTFIGGLTLQAFKDQHVQQDKHTGNVLDEDARTSGLQAQQNPGVASQLIQQHNDLIDKSTMTSEAKIERKAVDSSNMAYTAELARAQQDPMGTVVNKIIGVESGGNPNARNPNSSASGLGQFTNATWLATARKYAPEAIAGMSTPDILALKSDPAFSRQMVGAYTQENAGILSSAGYTVTAGNLYLAHFAGPQGAKNLLGAAPGASAASVLGQNVVDANPFLKGMNASDVVAWARDKMSSAEGQIDPGARRYMTPAQTKAVNETADTALHQQVIDTAQQQQTQHNNQLNNLYVQLSDGTAPSSAMANARSTWLTSYDEINKAQGIIDKRNAGAASLQVGQQLNGVGLAPGAPTPVANPYDKNHRDGIDAYYDDLVKKGVDPAKAADQIFQNTGVPPTGFVTALRGALGSQDPQKAAAVLTVADNMMNPKSGNPNAFAGTPGQSDIESQVAKFRSFQELGDSSVDAAQKMITNDNADRLNPVKKEQIDTFRKTVLTQDAIETRVKGLLMSNSPFSDKPSSVQLPAGLQRDTISSLYGQWAEQGFRQDGDQKSALAYADMEFQKQFGAQNGVITRYPPSKANLPSLLLPGQKDPLHWSYEQAAQETRDYLKSIGAPPEKYAGIDASQVIMTPVNQVVGGVRISTRSAFNGNPDTVYRSGGGDPAAGGAKQTSFQSIPYFIMINPKTPDQDPINVPHVFYPDVETYVADHNAQIATQPAAANGVGRGAAFHYPTPMMKTADQAQQDVYAQTAATHAASAQNNDYLNTTKANQISDLQSQLDLMPQNEFNKGSRDTLSAHIKILSEELGAQRRLESDGRKK